MQLGTIACVSMLAPFPESERAKLDSGTCSNSNKKSSTSSHAAKFVLGHPAACSTPAGAPRALLLEVIAPSLVVLGAEASHRSGKLGATVHLGEASQVSAIGSNSECVEFEIWHGVEAARDAAAASAAARWRLAAAAGMARALAHDRATSADSNKTMSAGRPGLGEAPGFAK